MRQTAAPRSSLDALDQWGIRFPLLPDDLAELAQPTPSSLARAISSWRLSMPALLPRHGDSLDQWGIEFPVTYDELAAFGANCRGGRSQARTSAILAGRLYGISRFGAYAAILSVVVAGSASYVPSNAPAGAPPTRNEPLLIVVADPTQLASLPSITERPIAERPSATSNPTPAPTPAATLAAETLGSGPISNIPAVAVHALQVESVPLPTVQDARNYLVARLGAKVDRYWGLSQSQCASQIFEDEAGWDPHATNKSSGAYGLPQAHPASKLADWEEAKAEAAEKAGDPEAAWLYRAWRDNPVVQAEWGVDYMTTRYGSPCAALTFRDGHWEHGVLIPGAGWY
jgi:hypothetical protein